LLLGLIGDSQAELILDSLSELNSSNTAALVLRVDSSGGTLPACERIKNAVSATGLPVAVSMGNMAASGGYYVSANADRIWASRKTITGSIGVFGARLDLSKAASRHGLTVDTVGSSELAGTDHSLLPMNHQMKENLSNAIDRYYTIFTNTVKEGRGLTNVEDVAGGRVWLGEEALGAGLVDAVGGMYRAVAYAQREYDASDEVVGLPKQRSSLEDFQKTPSTMSLLKNVPASGAFFAVSCTHLSRPTSVVA